MDRCGFILFWILPMKIIIRANDVCDEVNISLTLCQSLFPKNVLDPDNKTIPYQIPESSCVYQRYSKFLTITSYSYHPGSCNFIPFNKTKFNFGPSIKGISDVTIFNINITTLEEGIFDSWYGSEQLHIIMNHNLKRIQPGAFRNLSNVFNLTINNNPNLGPLEEETFRGLLHLQELRYLRNNIIRISHVASALNPLFLPEMTYLDFTGNYIKMVEEDDFKPLADSAIHTLRLSLTKTEWIHEKAFDPLNKLVFLDLQRNNLKSSVLTPLVNRMVKNNLKLTHLAVAENVLLSNVKEFLNAVAQNDSKILYLNLRQNHFGFMSPGFFPKMPMIEFLDLSDVMIDDMLEGVITHELMPKLQYLLLGKNIFSGLTSSMVTKTVSQLYLFDNNNNLPWTTFFDINPHVFLKIPNLELLDLTGNILNVLKKNTLRYALSLKVLVLKQTSLYAIEEGAFEMNRLLFFLDLSCNFFPVVTSFSKEIFRGLDNLIALDLSDCQISSIKHDDVFEYLKNLKFLSLRKNSISRISPSLFTRIPLLVVVDLRFNILVSWKQRIFQYNKYLNYTLLDYNHIQTFTDAMLKDFLIGKVVNLYGNSIVCDCNIMNAVAKLIDRGEIEDIHNLPFSNELNTCINLDRETLVSYLSMVNSAKCMNKQWMTIIFATIFTILFTTLIAYIVYYYYKYDIHFWFLKTKRRLGLLHYMGSNKRRKSDGFKYDAFVSYCIEDEKFVEKMVYILENDGSKFNLCVFERDFGVGDVLPEKIMQCMENSRKTILVLTESFAKSQWCCWEMYIAQSRSISLINSDPNGPLILIKKSEIPESYMTPTLRHLMKTRVYLEWHDNQIRQKIFWEQLKNSLGNNVTSK